MLRVLVDGYYLGSSRGFGRYLRESLHALALTGLPGVEITVVVPNGINGEFKISENIIRYEMGPRVPFAAWEQAYLPIAIARRKPDVFHAPYNTSPLVAFSRRARKVVTIHDLMFLDPRFGVASTRQRLGRIYRGLVVRNQRAEMIICVSRSSARAVRRWLSRDSVVIYTSIDLFARTPPDTGVVPDTRYLLHVGGTAPHKNTVRCIEAFRRAQVPKMSLVVTGIPSGHELATRNASDRILFPDRITDAAMVALYKQAWAVLFPSVMEGYGLPIVEAFAFDTPVITSNTDPMKELAGDAAVLVDPMSIDDLSQAIARVASEESLRSRLAETSRARFHEFRAERAGAQLLEAYRRASARTRNGGTHAARVDPTGGSLLLSRVLRHLKLRPRV